jgi:hypothetical protein
MLPNCQLQQMPVPESRPATFIIIDRPDAACVEGNAVLHVATSGSLRTCFQEERCFSHDERVARLELSLSALLVSTQSPVKTVRV